MHRLMQSPEVDNPTWINQVVVDKDRVYSSYLALRYKMHVPPEMRGFHNMLLDAVRDCHDIRYYIDDPRFPPSEDDLGQIERLLTSCQEKVQVIDETLAPQ